MIVRRHLLFGTLRLRVYYPDTPDLPLPTGHRFPAGKYGLLRHDVVARGLLKPDELIASPLASLAQLGRAHEADYVTAMMDGTVSAPVMMRIGLPWSEVLVARSRATAGGTLQAARTALVDGISGQLAGGTHHAHYAYGSGFCVFNDCAVAAFALLDERAVSRVAILDLDVHQGDGNAAIFRGEPRVFTASVHGEKNYPFEKAASSLDIGLPDGTTDTAYLAACSQALDAALAFEPDVMLYIAGVDPLASDRLGRLAVTHAGLLARDVLVLRACRSRGRLAGNSGGIPIVILAGGGYAECITDTVLAYGNTWQAACEVAHHFK